MIRDGQIGTSYPPEAEKAFFILVNLYLFICASLSEAFPRRNPHQIPLTVHLPELGHILPQPNHWQRSRTPMLTGLINKDYLPKSCGKAVTRRKKLSQNKRRGK